MLLILIIIITLLLCTISSVKVSESRLSHFEIERRASRGDIYAIAIKKQQKAYLSLAGLQSLVCLVLFTVDVLLGNLYGGLLAVFTLVLSYAAISLLVIRAGRATKLTSNVNRYWRTKIEPIIAVWLVTHPRIIKIFGSQKRRRDLVAASREELSYILETTTLIDERTKRILGGVNKTSDTTVLDIMIPLADIESVAGSELLGPLVIDSLHRKGIRYYPVIDDDSKRFVGVLDIGVLTSLSVRSTPLARSAMNKGIETILDSTNLIEAINLFLRSGSPLFIVVSEEDEPRGMITVADAIRAFTGGVLPYGSNITTKGDTDESDSTQ